MPLWYNGHYKSQAKTVYKVLFILASLKKKINWDFWDLGIKQYIFPDVKS